MRQFLKLRQQEQFEAEARAYEAMHESLLGKYRGKFVAVYQGRVIDADADKRALIARVFARYRRSPVYFQQVTEEKIPTVRIRTPRFSRA
ncbi:MAG: hypothetical protein HY784_03490 [Chloroflexi bacterium]|nr:hypothetical protein [Chloroflexota bacterium]